MNKTQQRVVLVLERKIKMLKEDEDDADMFSEYLDIMLDDIRSEDGFGTESQRDPRGDGRDDNWSMGRVEGIDR